MSASVKRNKKKEQTIVPIVYTKPNDCDAITSMVARQNEGMVRNQKSDKDQKGCAGAKVFIEWQLWGTSKGAQVATTLFDG